MDRENPPFTGDERTLLDAYLDYYRATLLRQLDGLTEEQAKWSPVPTGTSIWGLVSHMTWVERWWFAHLIGGVPVGFTWDDDPGSDWRGREGLTLEELRAEYVAECERSRAVFAAAGLDDLTHEPRPGRSVRRVAIHMIEETARHAGHGDIIRELIDGTIDDED
jgi:uncharacterized damage-inducible protein DinB